MKNIFKSIFLIPIFFSSVSFTSKDLNEFGNWIKFYGLNENDFVLTKSNINYKINRENYDLSENSIPAYKPLFYYSPDSAYFLDLHSFSVLIEKNSAGKLILTGNEVDQKIQLVKNSDFNSSILFYFGTTQYAETAIWRNSILFEIFGFIKNDNGFVPTIWKFDITSKTYSVFQSKKIFSSKPKSYTEEIILKPYLAN